MGGFKLQLFYLLLQLTNVSQENFLFCPLSLFVSNYVLPNIYFAFLPLPSLSNIFWLIPDCMWLLHLCCLPPTQKRHLKKRCRRSPAIAYIYITIYSQSLIYQGSGLLPVHQPIPLTIVFWALYYCTTNNVFSRHLGHLRTVSFMKMGARFLAKFTFAFIIRNMECFNGAKIFVVEIKQCMT